MKKLTLSMMVVLMGIGTAFAQISTGEPNASVLPRTGNRPQAGDFGMYLGASVTQVIDLVNLNSKVKMADDRVDYTQAYWALPMINLKYYITDQWEFRCGFEFAAQTQTSKTAYLDAAIGTTSASVNKNFTRFLPGAAYHFNSSNILDVYVGAQMPIGFNVNSAKGTAAISGHNASVAYNQGEFVLGGGVFLGLQFFVADLPFAIGFEGGYSGQAVFTNGDGKTTITTDGKKYVFNGYVPELSEETPQLASSSFMEGNWHADAAITFTYFFRK